MIRNLGNQSVPLFALEILLISLAIGPADAQMGSVKPGINEKFLSSELKVDEWTERFEGESRQIYAHRERQRWQAQ